MIDKTRACHKFILIFRILEFCYHFWWKMGPHLTRFVKRVGAIAIRCLRYQNPSGVYLILQILFFIVGKRNMADFLIKLPLLTQKIL